MISMSENYIKEIEDSLLNHRAAVLVGAGFSRNADLVNSENSNRMPTWNDLSDLLCDKLDIDESSRKYLNSLTVAQEFEETFGRPALDKFLMDELDDGAYEPSDIHVNLMSLRWSDVFTTNYDTLLERAAKKVANNKYKVIQCQDDLIYSAGYPRIIKLHGSFPSNRPFIITEEDFRTYPEKFAPFMNTVQQSLLENTFCLLGFSGDDPNFLKWIGWIHDNIGLKNSPVIYLITHRHFSSAKENDLLSKKIRIIALEDITNYRKDYKNSNNDDCVKNLYRNFLQDLVNNTIKKEDVVKDWPDKGLFSSYFYEKYSLNDIKNKLQSIHDDYPGWIFTPYSKIDSVKQTIRNFESIYFDRKSKKRDNLPPQEKRNLDQSEKEDSLLSEKARHMLCLDIAYEYSWLNSVIGRPLSHTVIKEINQYLSAYDALPLSEKTDETERRYNFILFQELRAFRISNDSEWKAIHDKLSGRIVSQEGKNQLTFEDIYHDIYELKLSAFENKINKIHAESRQHIWSLRKAGLLALVGRYAEAENILMASINNIRYKSTDFSRKAGIKSRSVESCLVTLYNFVIQTRKQQEKDFTDISNNFLDDPNREDELDFIWSQENNKFAAFLTDEYTFKTQVSRHPAFDLGMETSSVSFGREDNDYYTAQSFMAFRELTGIPLRLSNVRNYDGALGTAKRLAPYNAIIPVVISISAADDKIIQKVWNRSYLAGMPLDAVDELTDLCIDSLQFSLNQMIQKNYGMFKSDIYSFPAAVIPEFLSRLCARCSKDKFISILEIIRKIYDNREKFIAMDTKNLVRRLINDIPLEILIQNMDIFWDLPIEQDNTRASSEREECFTYIYDRFHNIYTAEGTDHLILLPIDEEKEVKLRDLFLKAADNKIHHNVIRRLTYISQIYEFNDQDQNTLESILLDKNNIKDGLPYLGDFYPSTIGLFIKNTDVPLLNTDGADIQENTIWNNALQALNDAVSKESLSDYSNILDVAISYSQHHTITGTQVINLAEKLLQLCKKLNRDLDGLSLAFLGNSVKKNLRQSAILMGEAILSTGMMDSDKINSSEQITKLHDLLKDADIPCSLLDYCLDCPDDREKHYLRNLFSGKKKYVSDAVESLYSFDRYHITISTHIKHAYINAMHSSLGTEGIFYIKSIEFMVRKGYFSKEELSYTDQALPKYVDLTATEENESEDSIKKKIALRELTSVLAHSMYRQETEKNMSITSGVMKWKELSLDPNEFVEIRNSWDDKERIIRAEDK